MVPKDSQRIAIRGWFISSVALKSGMQSIDDNRSVIEIS